MLLLTPGLSHCSLVVLKKFAIISAAFLARQNKLQVIGKLTIDDLFEKKNCLHLGEFQAEKSFGVDRARTSILRHGVILKVIIVKFVKKKKSQNIPSSM